MNIKNSKINLSRELFINGSLIGMCILALSSCGGGGGGSGASGQSSNPPPSILCPLSSAPNIANICQGADYPNEPIITIYVDGQPVDLLLDTGASGIMVNSSAVNIPSSDYTNQTFSGAFGDGSTYFGLLASATVCINPNYKNTCVVMLVNVDFQQTAFPVYGESQGDFGVDCGHNMFSSNAFCYFYYLKSQNINSYTLSFYNLSNGFYSTPSFSTPIGVISFGMYNGTQAIPYQGGSPSTTVVFPSYTSSIASFTAGNSFFDTGSNFNYLTTDVFKTEIPNFSKTTSEGDCSSSLLNGGLSISYNVYNLYSTIFLTEPPENMCSLLNQPVVVEGATVDGGYYSSIGYEDFGFPEMLRHQFVWILDNNGFVKAIGINN